VAIIRTKPGLAFWKNMSLQELGAKGKRGKDLRIMLPSGHENLIPGRDSDEGAETSDEGGETGDENEDEDQSSVPEPAESATGAAPTPARAHTAIKSFADACPAVGSPLASPTSLGVLNSAGSSSGIFSFAGEMSPSSITASRLPLPIPSLPTNSSHPLPSLGIPSSSTMSQSIQSPSVPVSITTGLKVEDDTRSVTSQSQLC
jgi:hypothetical protein